MLLFRKTVSLLAATAAAFLLAACNPAPQSVTLQGETMGTTYTVKYLSDGPTQAEAMQKELDALLEEVNRQMSTYRADSEISRFNQMRETNHPLPVADDFAFVTAEALRLNRLTQGALDVTVGPLVNLWGFGPDKTITREPSAAETEAAAQMVGVDKIVLNRESQPATLAKTHPETYLDLSAIAKGYGVDKLAQHLEKQGIGNYLVEIGGEVRAQGRNAEQQPWRIGIEQPEFTQGSSTQIIVPLSNRALATSGDYRNFRTAADGTRLSHIIDPNTRRPLQHKLASVSVVADTAATADGLATGLFVLGEQKALELAEKEKLAVFLIIYDQGGFQTAMSSEFQKLIKQDTP